MWLVPYRIISETFGDTEYDQDGSSLDFWLGSARAFFILFLIVSLRQDSSTIDSTGTEGLVGMKVDTPSLKWIVSSSPLFTA